MKNYTFTAPWGYKGKKEYHTVKEARRIAKKEWPEMLKFALSPYPTYKNWVLWEDKQLGLIKTKMKRNRVGVKGGCYLCGLTKEMSFKNTSLNDEELVGGLTELWLTPHLIKEHGYDPRKTGLQVSRTS